MNNQDATAIAKMVADQLARNDAETRARIRSLAVSMTDAVGDALHLILKSKLVPILERLDALERRL